MARKVARADSLSALLNSSGRPIYVVDVDRRIVYCNPALANWLDLKPEQIAGRLVEYHSEPSDAATRKDISNAPLTDLCPPPRSFAGEACIGTISCSARGGGLVHRSAEFVPLGIEEDTDGVFVLLAAQDLSPQEVTEQLSGTPSADELHRTIRRFRRSEATRYSIESILGTSSAMCKVRSQIAAAASSGANAVIVGQPGTGRGHVARAIHYHAAGDADIKLVPLDCELANDYLLRRALDAASKTTGDPHQRPTLLLENLNGLATAYQCELLGLIERRDATPIRIIATVGPPSRGGPDDVEFEADDEATEEEVPPEARPLLGVEPALFDAISTITVHLPRLVERLEDLPILAQFFLEACNLASIKQVGSVRAEALDLLAIHSWPGELVELQDVIRAAHHACPSHEISVVDLPPVVHHAASAAARKRRQPEGIVLDELLANIEREAIERALAQAGGNKSTAAQLLGMTRPRLYRRLVQLGLAGPEFVEEGAPENFHE